MEWLTAVGWVAAPLATAAIGWLAGSLKASRERERAHDAKRDAEHGWLMAGMREVMRAQLYEMHTRYVVEGQPMPYDEKEREDSVYRVYHALGGNGTGTHIHEELIAAFVGGREE
ncbi:hypothetical protein [Collinsella ihumii]|uniref:Uncharacterized protein n=1 Tax=Collinsella ihumii TaxID=1720204 RepID=A0ABT7XFK2_9ACTN|nr:hypothetical protein [Collinsella ihumii]MDN0055611.1 hypothetical protein [Collinsella ihumii]MDN0064194.1 hypothetical protein [Collinsella ihumii]